VFYRYSMKNFYTRIGYVGDLSEISGLLCNDFNLGEFKSNKLVEVGYEDFNFILETTKGKYFIKIFSNFRTDEDCHRYVEIIKTALSKGISTPKLYMSKQGYLHTITISKTKLRLVVMQFIDGETYFQLGENPTFGEIKELAKQAALINSINIKPSFVYDSWAVTNILSEYEKKGECLLPEDSKKIKSLMQIYKDMKVESLPHSFVHGDLISTNVMKDKDGKIWLVDFSVSNYYPRIQELAVMACNILFDEKNKENSERNLKTALDEYQKQIKLTPKELEVLPNYIKLAHAMHILGANYEKVVENNGSDENRYWYNCGKVGLEL